jgi:hypothetical protein
MTRHSITPFFIRSDRLLPVEPSLCEFEKDATTRPAPATVIGQHAALALYGERLLQQFDSHSPIQLLHIIRQPPAWLALLFA